MAAPEDARASGAAPPRAMLLPLIMLFAAGAAWGLHFSLAKIGAGGGVHPFGMLLWQTGGASVVVGCICAVRGRLGRLRRADFGFNMICGLSGIVVPSVAMFWVAPHLPAGVVAIMACLHVMATYGLSLAIGLERFDAVRCAGIGLGFVAVVLIIGPPESLPEPGMAGWVLLALVPPVGYAVNTVLVARHRPPGADSLALALGMMLGAFAIALPLALATGTVYMPGPPWDRVDAAVLGVPLVSGAALAFMFEIIRLTGPVFFSQVAYLVTASGVLWGMALFGERHGGLVWLALALMLAGIALVNARSGRVNGATSVK